MRFHQIAQVDFERALELMRTTGCVCSRTYDNELRYQFTYDNGEFCLLTGRGNWVPTAFDPIDRECDDWICEIITKVEDE